MMEITNILQHLFNTPSLEEVPLSSIQEMVEKYPYFAGAHFLLSRKLKQENNEALQGKLQKTNLYFHNPMWLHFNMEEHAQPATARQEVAITEPEPQPIPEPASTVTEPEQPKPAEPVLIKEEPAFDPYHTIDYFASLGIRLSQDPRPDDKLGQQLKSFTAWLKTMRRLPAETISETVEVNQADLNAHIEKIAAHSLVDKEVITQAMAEVLVMQGNRLKAAEIYHKLSLLNPDKSAYFAARIEELKQH